MTVSSYSSSSGRSRDLACWSYAAATISIIMYATGLLYCAWGIAEIETGFFKYKQTPKSFWEIMFAFDVTMYVSGIIASLFMLIGVLKRQRCWMAPWILISIVILAKQFVQMLIVLIVYRHEYFALLISMAQVLVFLSQVAFIMAVIMHYWQMKPKKPILMLQRYPSISSHCSMRVPLYFTPAIRHKF